MYTEPETSVRTRGNEELISLAACNLTCVPRPHSAPISAPALAIRAFAILFKRLLEFFVDEVVWITLPPEHTVCDFDSRKRHVRVFAADSTYTSPVFLFVIPSRTKTRAQRRLEHVLDGTRRCASVPASKR